MTSSQHHNFCLSVHQLLLLSHLVAIHLVAMLECKCFTKRNVDGIAHNGNSKGITNHRREQRHVWSLGGLKPGTVEKLSR